MPKKTWIFKADRPLAYNRTRVADLVAKLVERGLPHAGNKSELITRLQQDDRKKEARAESLSDAGNEPSGAAIGINPGLANAPTNTSTPYHGAYHGPSLGPDGSFSHFVRTIDNSHQQRGYWRFASTEDDRRAYARGFSSPEEVLLEQDRSRDCFDNITLRWVFGKDDKSAKGGLSGTASHHLTSIYELRMLLGQPLSLRGQVPVYPISQDPRLEKYWEAKANLQRLKVAQSPIFVTGSTTTPPPSPNSLLHIQSTIPESLSQQPRAASTQQTHTKDARGGCETSLHHAALSVPLPSRSTVSPCKSPPQAIGPPTSKDATSTNTSRPIDGPVDHELHGKPSAVDWGLEGGLDAPLVFELESLDDDTVFTNVDMSSTATRLMNLPDLPLVLPLPQTRESLQSSARDASRKLRQPSPSRPLSPLPPPPLHPGQSNLPSTQPQGQISEFDASKWGGFEQIEKDLAALDATYHPSSAHTVEVADQTIETAPCDAIEQSTTTAALESVTSAGERTIGSSELEAGGTSLQLAVPCDVPVSPCVVLDEGPNGMDWQAESEAPEVGSPIQVGAESPQRLPAAYLDIPCMDCGLDEEEGHKPDCHIGSKLIPLLYTSCHNNSHKS